MKLVELKCKNCGSLLNIEEGAKEVTCEYCHTKFALDDEAQHVKYDDMYESGYDFEKGRIKAQNEEVIEQLDKFNEKVKEMHKATKVPIFIFLVFFLIFFLSIVLFIVKGWEEMEISSFNSDFEMYSGTTTKFHINYLLDNVITNNKTNNNKKINVIYEDITTSDTDKIIDIKHKLKDNFTDYEVILDYDEKGFVNKVTIKELGNNSLNKLNDIMNVVF